MSIVSRGAVEDNRIEDKSYQDYVANAITQLSETIHGLNYRNWWTDPVTAQPIVRNTGELLCLVHSEISEAMEGDRKNLRDDHLPNRAMVDVELADAVIRIFDIAGARGVDIGGIIIEKLLYNKARADHKPENRIKAGGKAY